MSDALIPILKNNKDPHYRYKMPKLTAKVEGSGNGIKTVITNMVAVARSIDRPPSYPLKYFGCELGAQVTMNLDQYVVNGSHDPKKLLNLLYSFIKKFVLCTKCNNPETSLTIKGDKIGQKCIACGYDTYIPKAIHKITTFIINHPPDGSVNPMTSKKEKGSKGDKRSKKNSNSPTNGTHADSGNGDDAFNLNKGNDSDQFDDDDMTTDAYSERMRELCQGLNNGNIMRDAKESANILFKLVKEKKEAGLLQEAEVQKEIVKEAERLDIKDKSTLILSEVLFTENIVEEIKKNKMLLLRFCYENRKAQKYLLGGYEKLVGDVYHDKLFGSAMKIMKQFYDEDILDEEAIIEWSNKESKKYVTKDMSRKIHEKVAPFIKWLKEAEVEDDSSEEEEEDEVVEEEDEEDDDGIDLEFSHRVSGIQLQDTKPVVATLNPALKDNPNGDVENLDDDDIDDI